MGLIQEAWMRIVGTGILDYDIAGGDILFVLTIISTALLVRFLWVTLQDFRMFDIKLAIVYSILTSVTLYFGWARISESLGSFAGIVLLIVMFWGARTWTAS